MGAVGRYAKAVAKPGKGDELAQKLLEVARAIREAPGCQLYVVNRSLADPDVVWVTELWQSQEQLDGALETPEARERIPEVLNLVRNGGFERVDLEPLGGAGYQAGATGLAIVNLEQLEDPARTAGLREFGAMRFAGRAAGAGGLVGGERPNSHASASPGSNNAASARSRSRDRTAAMSPRTAVRAPHHTRPGRLRAGRQPGYWRLSHPPPAPCTNFWARNEYSVGLLLCITLADSRRSIVHPAALSR